MFEDNYIYKLAVLDEVNNFIDSLNDKDRAKIISAINTLRKGQFGIVHIKTLSGKIKELIVKNVRLTFFITGNIIYVVKGFIKKTNKTPKDEIEYAEKIYKIINNQKI